MHLNNFLLFGLIILVLVLICKSENFEENCKMTNFKDLCFSKCDKNDTDCLDKCLDDVTTPVLELKSNHGILTNGEETFIPISINGCKRFIAVGK